MGLTVVLKDVYNATPDQIDLLVKSQDEANATTRKIIAQRAYDLVDHALMTINDKKGMTWSQIIATIPDLTELPKVE